MTKQEYLKHKATIIRHVDYGEFYAARVSARAILKTDPDPRIEEALRVVIAAGWFSKATMYTTADDREILIQYLSNELLGELEEIL